MTGVQDICLQYLEYGEFVTFELYEKTYQSDVVGTMSPLSEWCRNYHLNNDGNIIWAMLALPSKRYLQYHLSDDSTTTKAMSLLSCVKYSRP